MKEMSVPLAIFEFSNRHHSEGKIQGYITNTKRIRLNCSRPFYLISVRSNKNKELHFIYKCTTLTCQYINIGTFHKEKRSHGYSRKIKCKRIKFFTHFYLLSLRSKNKLKLWILLTNAPLSTANFLHFFSEEKKTFGNLT